MKKSQLKRSSYLQPGTGKLRGQTGLKKSVYKLKKRQKTEEEKEIEQMARDADRRFYKEIWDSRPHYCQECGKYLGEEVNKACIDHLAEKSRWPVYRYNEENIWLVCLDHHAQKTAGFPAINHKKAIEEFKLKYDI